MHLLLIYINLCLRKEDFGNAEFLAGKEKENVILQFLSIFYIYLIEVFLSTCQSFALKKIKVQQMHF